MGFRVWGLGFGVWGLGLFALPRMSFERGSGFRGCIGTLGYIRISIGVQRVLITNGGESKGKDS